MMNDLVAKFQKLDSDCKSAETRLTRAEANLETATTNVKRITDRMTREFGVNTLAELQAKILAEETSVGKELDKINAEIVELTKKEVLADESNG